MVASAGTDIGPYDQSPHEAAHHPTNLSTHQDAFQFAYPDTNAGTAD